MNSNITKKNYDFKKMVEDLDEYEKTFNQSFDDVDEEYVTCVWCGEDYPESECRLEADMGYLCDRCAEAIKSRGEKLTFIENLEDVEASEDSSNAEAMNEDLADSFDKSWKAYCFNSALKIAKERNKPVIYGYSDESGNPVMLYGKSVVCTSGDVAKDTEDFKKSHLGCNIVYVAYPDKGYVKLESLSSDVKEKIKRAVDKVFAESADNKVSSVDTDFDTTLFDEPETDTDKKYFACYFRGKHIGDLLANDADEAYAAMEERWPFLPYGEYDGIATVEEIDESEVGKDVSNLGDLNLDFSDAQSSNDLDDEDNIKATKVVHPSKKFNKVTATTDRATDTVLAERCGKKGKVKKKILEELDLSDYEDDEDFRSSTYPDYEIEYPDIDVEVEGDWVKDYYDPSSGYGHGQRSGTVYGKVRNWTYSVDLTIDDFAEFLKKPADEVTLEDVKAMDEDAFDDFLADKYYDAAAEDAAKNYDSDDVDWKDPDYDYYDDDDRDYDDDRDDYDWEDWSQEE